MAGLEGGDDAKRGAGRYFTVGSVFESPLFDKWAQTVDGLEGETILESFAGANHMVEGLRQRGWKQGWAAFDIRPAKSVAAGVVTRKRDTLADFPKGFRVCVTNPPYLARNSASRRGLPFPNTAWDDLCKMSLEKILDNVGWAACVVPESFVASGCHRERLYGVVSLPGKRFADTDHPVCLALFVPQAVSQTELWTDSRRLGTLEGAMAARPDPKGRFGWLFNDPTGQVGVRCVDGVNGSRARFVAGGFGGGRKGVKVPDKGAG